MNTVKDECREAKGLGGFDALEREARHGARQLWRSPGFTATVVLTLALAVGANTAIFSLVNALLLNELPYPHPERIGTLYARTSGPQASDRRRTIDGEQWDLLRTEVPSLLPAVSAMGVRGELQIPEHFAVPLYTWRQTPDTLSRSSASLRSDHDAVVHVITMEWTE